MLLVCMHLGLYFLRWRGNAWRLGRGAEHNTLYTRMWSVCGEQCGRSARSIRDMRLGCMLLRQTNWNLNAVGCARTGRLGRRNVRWSFSVSC